MQFRVLGSLEVWVAGRRLTTLTPRQERFLARLLLSPNTLVSIGALSEALWDGAPPDSAERQVQNTASQLRRTWMGAGMTDMKEVLQTARSGYVLEIDRDQIDLEHFRDMVIRATSLTKDGDSRSAAGTLRRALALWRAPAFAGIESRVIRQHALVLDEERFAAWETRLRLDLEAGLHGQVVAELTALVAEFPFREQLIGLLMTALYRAGRQTDALHTYQMTCARLSAELGIDPGPELQQLHQQILQNDPTLLEVAAHESGLVASLPGPLAPYPQVPRQVPPADGYFTGRRDELEALVGYCSNAQAIIVTGAAGMGKTSLAVQTAHRVGGRFPDGHLFLDLRGHNSASSRSPTGVLSHLLEGLNLPSSTISGSLERHIALYRSITADKKLLIVLDNAGSVEQVLPAVPAAGGSQLIVTSRNTLAALRTHVVVEGLTLRGLGRAASRSILTHAVAVGRLPNVATPALERVIDICAGMPLALRILAARILSEPALTIENLAADLTPADGSLDVLTVDTDARSVRSVLASACAPLAPQDAQLMWLLAVHPGRRIRVEAAATLAGVPLLAARAGIDALAALHLLTDGGDGYLTMHDLVRSFATEQLGQRQNGSHEAADRLLDWYLALAAQASDVLRPDRDAYRAGCKEIDTFVGPFAKDVEAINFFNAERDNLGPVIEAAARDRLGGAVELAYHLHSYFVRTGFPAAVVETLRTCEHEANRIADPLVLAHLYHVLGGALAVANEPEAAQDRLRLSAELYESAGDLAGAAGARLGLGFSLDAQGRYQDALNETERGLELARAAGNTTLEVHALNNSGDILVALGESDAALDRLEAGRRLARDCGLRHYEAAILGSIGALFVHRAEHATALGYLHEGLALMRRSGFRTAEAETLGRIGHAVLGSGNREGAAEWFRTARDVHRKNNDVAGEAAMSQLISGLTDRLPPQG
jgi:DNA-binding SARP family transcriptional activator/tetratricopeptide (TPR) repeat protein